MIRLSDALSAMDDWFPPASAESWDAVGLVCGDPADPIERILLAVDPVPAVVAQAEQIDAQLIITHHPLLLDAVHGVSATSPKGALIHRLIRAGRALHVAHTNADAASPGVSDALARRLGIIDVAPLSPIAEPALDRIGVYVPLPDVERVRDALADAGAGAIGSYDRCAWAVEGSGTFRPLPGAAPAIGEIGQTARVAEARLEMAAPAGHRARIVAALRASHPYETPAFDIVATAALPGDRGIGRIGRLGEPTTLRAYAARVARALPPTAWGVRAAGDPDQPIERVAVCGGAGGSLIDVARAAGADAYVTADLRHHVASEATAERADGPRPPMALIDAAHWATERPWLDDLAAALRGTFGTTVSIAVSDRSTDPWTLHEPSDA